MVGHMQRMSDVRMAKQVLHRVPEDRRRRGRPRSPGNIMVNRDIEKGRMSWEEAMSLTADRREWRNWIANTGRTKVSSTTVQYSVTLSWLGNVVDYPSKLCILTVLHHLACGLTFVDVTVAPSAERCEQHGGRCEQLCVDVNLGIRCDCHHGYVLNADATTCQGKQN